MQTNKVEREMCAPPPTFESQQQYQAYTAAQQGRPPKLVKQTFVESVCASSRFMNLMVNLIFVCASI